VAIGHIGMGKDIRWRSSPDQMLVDHFHSVLVILGQLNPLPHFVWHVSSLRSFHIQVENTCMTIIYKKRSGRGRKDSKIVYTKTLVYP
jgi:hypothetical protein